MHKGENVAGLGRLHEQANQRIGEFCQYHVADKNGRAYLCGCFRQWRVGTEVKWPASTRNSRTATKRGEQPRPHLNLWYRTHDKSGSLKL